jgi:hypothetical protein
MERKYGQRRDIEKGLLLLAEGFEMIGVSGFTDVFAWASLQEDISISVTSAAIRY